MGCPFMDTIFHKNGHLNKKRASEVGLCDFLKMA